MVVVAVHYVVVVVAAAYLVHGQWMGRKWLAHRRLYARAALPVSWRHCRERSCDGADGSEQSNNCKGSPRVIAMNSPIELAGLSRSLSPGVSMASEAANRCLADASSSAGRLARLEGEAPSWLVAAHRVSQRMPLAGWLAGQTNARGADWPVRKC